MQAPFRFTTFLYGLIVAFGLLIVADLVFRGMRRVPTGAVWEVEGGDAQRGREAIVRYGCGACHVIPGIRGANGRVGPQLYDFLNQIYIAGMLPNRPENLIVWIQNPRGVNPGTAMPDMGITEAEARDIAAYIYANP
jgi:cytochrome c